MGGKEGEKERYGDHRDGDHRDRDHRNRDMYYLQTIMIPTHWSLTWPINNCLWKVRVTCKDTFQTNGT